MLLERVAVQLNSVRDQMALDPLATLDAVAGIGYRAVEFAGTHGVSPLDLRAALDERGLRTVGCHIPFERLTEEFDNVVEETLILGAEFLTFPRLPRIARSDAESLHRLCETFNLWGSRCADAGLLFTYHNHDFDFFPIPGSMDATILDLLLAQTDRRVVHLELDVYWAHYASVDATSILKRHASRIPLLHLKDMGPDPAREDVPVGHGSIDWRDVLTVANPSPLWYIVEQDNSRNPIADLRASFQTLSALS